MKVAVRERRGAVKTATRAIFESPLFMGQGRGRLMTLPGRLITMRKRVKVPEDTDEMQHGVVASENTWCEEESGTDEKEEARVHGGRPQASVRKKIRGEGVRVEAEQDSREGTDNTVPQRPCSLPLEYVRTGRHAWNLS